MIEKSSAGDSGGRATKVTRDVASLGNEKHESEHRSKGKRQGSSMINRWRDAEQDIVE